MSRLKILVVALLLVAVPVQVVADIRQRVVLLNSRGRPWLGQTVICKLTGDTAAVDTAFESGGGQYYFQVDPDSGFSTDVYDVYRGTTQITGLTAIRLGLPEDPDSTSISPGSIAYSDLNLDRQVDSTDVNVAALAWRNLAFADTIFEHVIMRRPVAGSTKGFTIGVTDDAADFTGLGGWGLKVVNANSSNYGLVVDATDATYGGLKVDTGGVLFGTAPQTGLSAFVCYHATEFSDTVVFWNAPKTPDDLAGGYFRGWARVDSIVTGQDTCLINMVRPPDWNDAIILSPESNVNLWVDYREAWGFRVRAPAPVGADTRFDWLVVHYPK